MNRLIKLHFQYTVCINQSVLLKINIRPNHLYKIKVHFNSLHIVPLGVRRWYSANLQSGSSAPFKSQGIDMRLSPEGLRPIQPGSSHPPFCVKCRCIGWRKRSRTKSVATADCLNLWLYLTSRGTIRLVSETKTDYTRFHICALQSEKIVTATKVSSYCLLVLRDSSVSRSLLVEATLAAPVTYSVYFNLKSSLKS